MNAKLFFFLPWLFTAVGMINPYLSNALDLGGIISSDLTLYASDNPHHVLSTIQVPQGVTLTITEGVELFFHDQTYTEIAGNIRAIGTEASPILFTGIDENAQWGGFMIYTPAQDYNPTDDSGCKFEYCRFEHVNLSMPAEELLNTAWAVASRNTSYLIDHCTAMTASFFTFGAGATIRHSYLNHSSFWVDYYTEGMSFFQNNEITNSGAGIQIIDIINGVVSGNYIHDNEGSAIGIRITGGSVEVSNNLFVNNGGSTIGVTGGSNHQIVGNTFSGNDINLWMLCEREMNVSDNCFLSYNDYHIYLDGGPEGSDFAFIQYDCSNMTEPAEIDFTNNYFNGLSENQIATSIFDASDDISGSEPFSAIFIPTLSEGDCLMTDVDQHQKDMGYLNIFPNPCDDQLNILVEQANTTVRIFDVLGNLKEERSGNFGLHSLNTEFYMPGIYVLQAGNHSVRFIVNH